MYKGIGDTPCGRSASPWCPLHPTAPSKEVEPRTDTKDVIIVRSISRQAWGVAFRDQQKNFKWCHTHGPRGWRRYTQRQAIMDALKSNNTSFDGPYFPFPLVDVRNFSDEELIDIQQYTEGPYSEFSNRVYAEAFRVLAGDPEVEFHQLREFLAHMFNKQEARAHG